MKLDRCMGVVVVGLGLASGLGGCARPRQPASPLLGDAQSTAVGTAMLTSAEPRGPRPKTGKVQRAEAAELALPDAEDDLADAPKETGRRPSDRNDAGRQGNFGTWK